MLRIAPVLVAALALAACKGTISEEDCTKAGEAGTWDVSFSKSTGPDSCPSLEKSFTLPDKCEQNCNCPQAAVTPFNKAPNAATEDTCSIRFYEQCPGYALDCLDVQVDSATHASGYCYYKVGTDVCGYNVEWSKQ